MMTFNQTGQQVRHQNNANRDINITINLKENIDSEKNNIIQKLKVLFLAVNPINTQRLQLLEEMREIKQILNQKKMLFEIETATRPIDFIQAMLSIKPNIVHFSGHGTEIGEFLFQDNQAHSCHVSPISLKNFFRKFSSHIKCIILNCCFSEQQAEQIVSVVPYVIGMSGEISDQAAIAFSQGFYHGLSLNDEEDINIKLAYEIGRSHVEMISRKEGVIPKIFCATSLAY